jgi:hypothetical protein
MSKPKRPKQTATRQTFIRELEEKTILFSFDASKHHAALNELLATLQENIYSAEAKLVLSEDGTQAKITLRGNIAQMNNLDGFLRNVPGVKTMSEDPNADMVRLIKCYHHNLWDNLVCPHDEMRLSAFVSGMGSHRAILDYPDWSAQPDVWKLAETYYQALEESALFNDLAAYHEMVLYSFMGGYIGEQGRCERDNDQGKMQETAVFKAQVLLMEEQGRSDIIIHTFAEQIRDTLIKKDHRNVMELIKPLGRMR